MVKVLVRSEHNDKVTMMREEIEEADNWFVEAGVLYILKKNEDDPIPLEEGIIKTYNVNRWLEVE